MNSSYELEEFGDRQRRLRGTYLNAQFKVIIVLDQFGFLLKTNLHQQLLFFTNGSCEND